MEGVGGSALLLAVCHLGHIPLVARALATASLACFAVPSPSAAALMLVSICGPGVWLAVRILDLQPEGGLHGEGTE